MISFLIFMDHLYAVSPPLHRPFLPRPQSKSYSFGLLLLLIFCFVLLSLLVGQIITHNARGANVPVIPRLTHIWDTLHGLINWVNMYTYYIHISTLYKHIHVYNNNKTNHVTLDGGGRAHMSWKEKNCYNNAWVYNVYVGIRIICIGYINLRIESQHPLVMVQIIFGNCLFFIHPT